MQALTRQLWDKQDQHRGDRHRLFQAVASAVEGSEVLYPGSFVDVAPSFVFPWVTYVDVDARAAKFFSDTEGVEEIVGHHRRKGAGAEVQFVHADYSTDLGLADESFDVLISLYAGFVSEHCTRYLRVGGVLLANSSHGDVAMATLDPRYELTAVVESNSGKYRVKDSQLDTYLIPKSNQSPTVASLHKSGKGVAYTKSPFAYLFKRTT